MAEYVGHIITAIGLIVAGAVGFGILKAIVGRNREDTDDQEKRLRVLEAAKLQSDAHIQEASGVLDRLRGIETNVAKLRADPDCLCDRLYVTPARVVFRFTPTIL